TAVAGRRRYHHGGPRVQPELIDIAGDGAGNRPRRRRCDRRPRERLSPHRRRPYASAGGADRRPRDRWPGHLDDPDFGGGLCPDRFSRRRDRRLVPRIRVYLGWGGHYFRRGRGDVVADDVLAVALP